MVILSTVLVMALTRAEILERFRAPVVTQADGLVQVSALHAGTSRMSAREFTDELVRTGQEITNFVKKLSESNQTKKG